MRAALIILTLAVAGCNAGGAKALKRDDSTSVEVYTGIVMSAAEHEMPKNESATARALVGGIPGLITEDLSVSGWRYQVRVESGLVYVLDSHSVVTVGECVRVREFEDDHPILIPIDCAEN